MDTIHCRILTPEQISENHPSLPFWFKSMWMNAIAEMFNIIPRVVQCSNKDNTAALFPFYEKKTLVFKKAYNPTLVYYNPIFFNLPEKKLPNHTILMQYEITKQMGAFLSDNYSRIHLNLDPAVYDIRGFKDAKLTAKPHYTFIYDLDEKAEFFIKEMTTLRIALKQGYLYKVTFEPESALELIYKMYNRKSHPFPIKRESLHKLLQKLNEQGIVEQHNIIREDKIVSSCLVLTGCAGTAYGWLMASEPEDMKQGAVLLLFWNMFNELSQRFTAFDLCGANSKGPSRFKAALGAELKLFFQIEK